MRWDRTFKKNQLKHWNATSLAERLTVQIWWVFFFSLWQFGYKWQKKNPSGVLWISALNENKGMHYAPCTGYIITQSIMINKVCTLSFQTGDER